jgi:hypothetical protein
MIHRDNLPALAAAALRITACTRAACAHSSQVTDFVAPDFP